MSQADERITRYGQTRVDAGRCIGVQVRPGLQVLVTPSTPADEVDADALARRILDTEADAAASRVAITALQNANKSLAEKVRRLEAMLADARDLNHRAIAGRRRFFGPVALSPERDGQWDGPVWLLDPEKLEPGNGLRFESLAELRSMHPELWIVSVTARGDVMLDAWGQG